MRLPTVILVLAALLAGGLIPGYLPGATASSREFEPVFEDSFETGSDWQEYEEPVDEGKCYGKEIGEVARSQDYAYDGQYSLRVWANQALSIKSNHVIAYKNVIDSGRQGIWRYQIHARISPDTATTGQTGPEFSIQNTRAITPTGTATYIAGIQYIANIYSQTGEWKVWDNADWTTFMTSPLTSTVWYTLTLEADFSANTYRSFSLQGNGLDQFADLSSYPIAGESRGFAEAMVITLESENLWNNCGTAGNFQYRMYYDKIALHREVAKIYLPVIRR